MSLCLFPLVLPTFLGGAPPQEDVDPAQLVPADAVVVLRFQSVERLESVVERLSRSVGQEAPDTAALLGGLPGDLTTLDRTTPVFIAVSMPADMPSPSPVFIMRAVDPSALEESLATEGLQAETKGSWVVARLAPAAGESGTSELVKGMPDGLVALRVDFATIFDHFGEMIEMQLAMVEGLLGQELGEAEEEIGFDPAQMLDPYFRFIRDFMRSAQTLDVALTVGEPHAKLRGSLELEPGSALGGWSREEEVDLASLVSILEQDAMFGFAGSMDMQRISEWTRTVLEPLMSSAEEGEVETVPGAAAMRTYLDKMDELAATLDGRFAGWGDLGPEGLRGSAVYGAKDPQAYVDLQLALAREAGLDELGLRFVEGENVQVGDQEARQIHFAFDWNVLAETYRLPPDEANRMEEVLQEMIGSELVFTMLPLSDRLLVAFGGDAGWRQSELEQAKEGSGSPPGRFAPVLEHVSGANPAILASYDFGRLFSTVSRWANTAEPGAEAPELPRDLSFPLLLWWGADQLTWEFGTSFSIDQLGDFAQALQRLGATAQPQEAVGTEGGAEDE